MLTEEERIQLKELLHKSLYYDKEEFVNHASYTAGKENGEKNKALEIAKNLLDMNLSIKDIVKATDITQEEIEELK